MDRWLGRLDRDAAAALGWLAIRPRWAAAFLITLCLALGLPGIASLPVTDRDEARFAQASRQMAATGDYVDIRFQDSVRYKKPIGIYWLQSASVQLLSSPEAQAIWAYRVPSFLAIMACALLVWWAAGPLYGRQNALLAAVLLAAAFDINLEARLAKSDAALLVFIILQQGALGRMFLARDYLALEGRTSTAGTAALFWIALGLGTLVKGPIAPALAVFTILPLAIADPDRSWLRNLRWAWGVPLVLLIVLPWFIIIGVTSGGEFYQRSLGEDFISKLRSGQENHWGPPGYYLVLFWWTFWPGALVATGGGALWLWRNRMHRRALFLLAWIIPFWLAAEATPTKLPHYILPIYPAIAIGAAWVLREVAIPRAISLTSYKQATLIWLLVAVLQAGFLVFVQVKFRDAPSPVLVLLAIPFAAVAYMTVRAAWQERFHAALVTAVICAALLYTAAFRVVLPGVEALWPSNQLAEIAGYLRNCNNTPFMLTRYREPSAVFLLGTETRMAEENAALDALRKREVDFAVFQADAFNRIARAGGPMPQVVGCVNGFHTTRGRKLRLHVLTMKAPEELTACPLPASFHCGRK